MLWTRDGWMLMLVLLPAWYDKRVKDIWWLNTAWWSFLTSQHNTCSRCKRELKCLRWSACSQNKEKVRDFEWCTCRCLCLCKRMGLSTSSWWSKCIYVFNNFRGFGICSSPVFVFHLSSFNLTCFHFFCCFFPSSPIGHVVLWVQRLFFRWITSVSLFSWVNIKFNMMHQINVCSVLRCL